jgi:O-antigen/teichoic acid export membrane protein
MVWTRKKAITDITFVIASQYIIQFILLLRGFIFAKYLGPEQFGVYSAIFLFYTYGIYSHLGITDGLWRLVPYFIGSEENEKAKNYLVTGFWGLNLFASIFLVSVIIYISIASSDFIVKYRIPILLSATAVILFFNLNFALLKFQFSHKFRELGIYQTLLSFFDLLLSLILMFRLGVTGIYLGMNIALLFLSLLSLYKVNFKVEWRFKIFELKEILKIGFVNLIIGFGLRLLMTVDKFSVANFFDKANMGFYSVAYSIGMLSFLIPMGLNQVIAPRMIEEFGRTKEIKSLKIFLDESLLFISFIVPFIAIFVIAFAEPFIAVFLPKYLYSLKLIDKLAIAFYFLSLSAIPLTFLVTINQRREILISEFVLISLMFFLNYMVFKLNLGLTWITYVSVVGYVLYFICVSYLSYRKFYSFRKIIRIILKFSLPSILIFFAFSLKFLHFDENEFLFKFLGRVLIGVVWLWFAILYLKKKTSIISDMINILKRDLGI